MTDRRTTRRHAGAASAAEPDHNGRWFRIDLGDPMLADPALEAIRAAYRNRYGDAKPAAAVFYRHESDGHLHCALRIYFSPACRALADSTGARPCPNRLPVASVSCAATRLAQNTSDIAPADSRRQTPQPIAVTAAIGR